MRGIDFAKQYIGLEEVKDNQKLRELLASEAHDGDIAIDPAKTSWCAAFVNCMERMAGKPGTGKLNAQSFNTYGKEIDIDDAEQGDIVVFHFSGDADWQGHVTYFNMFIGENQVQCLGGNQSNKVCYSTYSCNAIRHIRRS